MNDQIILNYTLKNTISWDEVVEVKIPLQNLSEYMQITKVLAAMINFFVKIGYNYEMISEAYNDIATQIEEKEEEPNYNSTDEEIDKHIKDIEKYDERPLLTLAQFKNELKKEAFIQYLYQMFIDDDRIIN